MPTREPAGMTVDFAVDVRKGDGTFLYHEATIKQPVLPYPPIMPDCPDRIPDYKWELDYWVAFCKEKADYYKVLHEYHSARSAYCMNHRDDEIEEKYRTGEPFPATIKEAKEEIKKLRR